MNEYKGVPIPSVLMPNQDRPEFYWWKRGVSAAQAIERTKAEVSEA
jgi:hypothetical protein